MNCFLRGRGLGLILAGALAFPLFGDDDSPLVEYSQNPQATFRLYQTQNIFMFLKLDTRTGAIWQVQWSAEPNMRFEEVLCRPITPKGIKPGRFALFATRNIYNFILLDQDYGIVLQIQWGSGKKKMVLEIPRGVSKDDEPAKPPDEANPKPDPK